MSNPKPKMSKKEKELLKSLDPFITDLVPIKSYVHDGQTGFKLDDNKYFNIFQVVMKDYYNMEDSNVKVDESVWDRYYRTINRDFKFNSLNLPLDTSDNVHFLRKKKEQTTDTLKKRILDEHIQSFKELRNRQVLQTYLLVFADSEEDMVATNNKVYTILGNWYVIKAISVEDKVKVLRKINNIYC